MSRSILATVAFVIGTMLFTWQVAELTRDWRLQNLHRTGSDQLLEVVSQLRAALDEYRYLPFLISQNNAVKSLLLQSTADQSAAVSLYLEQTNLVAGTSSLFVLNTQGEPLAYSHWRDQRNFFFKSHQSADYFLHSREGKRGRQFSLNAQTQQPAYFLSSPVYAGSRFAGVAVARIELHSLFDKFRTPASVLLSNYADQLFFTTGPLQRFATVEEQVKVTALELGDGSTSALWSRGHKQWLARSVKLDDLQWQVTVLQEVDTVNQHVRNAVLFSFGGCFALGLLALFMRERQLKLRSQDETRQTLARSEAQQKAIINNAQVGLLLIDADARIVFANETALQQFSVSMPVVDGKPLQKLLAITPDSPVYRLLARISHRGFSPLIGYEAVGLRGDASEFPLMISIRKMMRATEKQFIVTIIDISRRKGLEVQLQKANESLEHKVAARTQALQAAQDELVQAGKMAAIGRMSTAVVHELNQPLTAMRNYVAICKQMQAQPDMLQESLGEIDALTQRMATITSQLKTFAYRKPGQSEAVSAQMSIEHTLQLFKHRIQEQQVELELNLPPTTLYILGDSARLDQALINLIKNALDAVQTEAKPRLTIALESIDDKVMISIADNGPGIEQEMLAQLFEPFATSKPMGEGLGLGLAIVKSIMRDLNGAIEVAPSTTRGACFILRLPQTADAVNPSLSQPLEH